MNTNTLTVYVRLLDEGTEVLRPVLAALISGNEYQLLEDQDYDQDDEEWEFPPGTRVICDYKTILDKISIVAQQRA